MVSFDKSFRGFFFNHLCLYHRITHLVLKAAYNMKMFLGCNNFVICKQNTKYFALETCTSHSQQCDQIYISGSELRNIWWATNVLWTRDPFNSTLSPFLNEAWIMYLTIMKNKKRWCINIQNPNPEIFIHNVLISPPTIPCPSKSLYWISWKGNKLKLTSICPPIFYLGDL